MNRQPKSSSFANVTGDEAMLLVVLDRGVMVGARVHITGS
jgi:hypothetical protein